MKKQDYTRDLKACVGQVDGYGLKSVALPWPMNDDLQYPQEDVIEALLDAAELKENILVSGKMYFSFIPHGFCSLPLFPMKSLK